MDKGKIKAMVTKFSKKFAIIMLKKHRKFCRGGLTHLAATPTFQKSFRSFWFTLYTQKKDMLYKYVYRCEANVKNTMCSPFQGESTHVLCSLKDYIIVTY